MAAGVDVTQPLGPPQVLEMNMNCSLEAGTGEGGRDGGTTQAVTPRVKRNRDGQLTERRSEEAPEVQLVGDLNCLSAHGTRGELDAPVEPSSPRREVRLECAGPGMDAKDPELEEAMSARSTSGDSPARKPRGERRRRRPRPKYDEESRRLEAAASLAYRQGHHGFRFHKYCALYGEASWRCLGTTLQSLSVRSMSSAASKHFDFVSDRTYECT